ncbi:uncharacterized protein LOC123648543 [Lemur catta]|uniref:uncharacterized protein LOC123648543 n=1 Tax=Lemur catta TaxID=9447 RepID=UPI001E266990|nr:uncharacterized protein LOC123648543 [Lemur catta]
MSNGLSQKLRSMSVKQVFMCRRKPASRQGPRATPSWDFHVLVPRGMGPAPGRHRLEQAGASPHPSAGHSRCQGPRKEGARTGAAGSLAKRATRAGAGAGARTSWGPHAHLPRPAGCPHWTFSAVTSRLCPVDTTHTQERALLQACPRQLCPAQPAAPLCPHSATNHVTLGSQGNHSVMPSPPTVAGPHSWTEPHAGPGSPASWLRVPLTCVQAAAWCLICSVRFLCAASRGANRPQRIPAGVLRRGCEGAGHRARLCLSVGPGLRRDTVPWSFRKLMSQFPARTVPACTSPSRGISPGQGCRSHEQ